MTSETKPGDPADRGVPEDNFGNVQTHATHSHRAGYGDDKLTWLVDFLRRNPRATLASGEGALLLAEIDRLRVELSAVKAERDTLRKVVGTYGKVQLRPREDYGLVHVTFAVPYELLKYAGDPKMLFVAAIPDVMRQFREFMNEQSKLAVVEREVDV